MAIVEYAEYNFPYRVVGKMEQHELFAESFYAFGFRTHEGLVKRENVTKEFLNQYFEEIDMEQLHYMLDIPIVRKIEELETIDPEEVEDLFLTVDMYQGHVVIGFYDEEREISMYSFNPKFEFEDALSKADVSGQSPVLKRYAIDDMESVKEAIWYIVQYGGFSRNIDWAIMEDQLI